MVSYGVCMVSVRFLYESTTVHDGTTTDNKGKRRWHYGQHDATTVRYGACMVKPIASRAPTIACGLMVIMIMKL